MKIIFVITIIFYFMKQIKELQRLLGKKTMENELLKEAVEYGRAKKWIAHAPLLPGDGE